MFSNPALFTLHRLFHVDHNVSCLSSLPPPPLNPSLQKNKIKWNSKFLNYSLRFLLGHCNTQEKLEAVVMQNFWRLTRCIMVCVKTVNAFNRVSRSFVDEDGFVDKRSGYEFRNVCQSISLVEGKAISVFIATTVLVNVVGLQGDSNPLWFYDRKIDTWPVWLHFRDIVLIYKWSLREAGFSDSRIFRKQPLEMQSWFRGRLRQAGHNGSLPGRGLDTSTFLSYDMCSFVAITKSSLYDLRSVVHTAKIEMIRACVKWSLTGS